MTAENFVVEFGSYLCGVAEKAGNRFAESNFLGLSDSGDCCHRIQVQVQVLHCLTLHHTLALSNAPIFSSNHELRSWLQSSISVNFGKRCENNFGAVTPVQNWSRRQNSLCNLARQCSSYNPQTFNVETIEAALVTLSFRTSDFINEMQQGAIEGLSRHGSNLDLYIPALRHMTSEIGIDKVTQDTLSKMSFHLNFSAAMYSECLDLARGI